MAKTWEEANDTVGVIAGGLIPNYHPELATARIQYVFVSEASSKGGQELLGRVKKLAGFLEWSLESDYVIEVAQDKWTSLEQHQRTALVDHLLERCTGEEDEKTGEMRWKVREPNVQEFDTILDRHGAWHPQLAGFVSIAKRVNLDGLLEEEEADLNDTTVAVSETNADDSDDSEEAPEV
jgi:hypothetical protein